MYKIFYTSQFKKKIKLCQRRGLDMRKLYNIINLLISEGKLPATYHPHRLSGNMSGLWECHIGPDWLLIWEQNNDEFTLLMIDTGTHSDIF